ncbi:MAG TPA: biotin synthase BioB [Nitrososphaeraceae archaeon]|nr:biotin synthase BioB [Nitrososphaeraceae archaeon]
MNKVISGESISFEEAGELLCSQDILSLAYSANVITRKFNGYSIDIESLLNAKSGKCPEDCSFCAQSSFYNTKISKYPLLPKQVVIVRAKEAERQGASSFCLVCAYRSPPEEEFRQICDTIEALKKEVSIDFNASLGFMTSERARKLKSLGIKRYNHNLEASDSFFSQICKTHDFADRVKTAKIVKEAGLELCCGGIIGMGETVKQRIELAFALAALNPDEVPINILIPNEGTPMAQIDTITPEEAIRTIAVWRFIMPKVILKLAGGREVHFSDNGRMALRAGANGIISGGYLTTGGNEMSKDLNMIHEIGIPA